jgi:hypothetical protein
LARWVDVMNWEVFAKYRNIIENDKFEALQKGIQDNPGLIYLTSENSSSLLMESAHWGAFNCMSILIEYGADMEKINKYGVTALIYAAAWDNIDIAKYLLQKGAIVSHRNHDGNSAFKTAINRVSCKKEWVELFFIYKNKMDECDLELYYQMRLSTLFT